MPFLRIFRTNHAVSLDIVGFETLFSVQLLCFDHVYTCISNSQKKVGDGFLIKNPGSSLTIGRSKIQVEIKIKIS